MSPFEKKTANIAFIQHWSHVFYSSYPASNRRQSSHSGCDYGCKTAHFPWNCKRNSWKAGTNLLTKFPVYNYYKCIKVRAGFWKKSLSGLTFPSIDDISMEVLPMFTHFNFNLLKLLCQQQNLRSTQLKHLSQTRLYLP